MSRAVYLGLGLLVLCARTSAQDAVEQAPEVDGIAALLAPPIADAEQAGELAKRLAAQGTDGSSVLLEVLADGSFASPELGPEGVASRVELDSLRREAVLASFALVSRSGLRARLASLPATDPRPDLRRAALEAFAIVGVGDDLGAMVALATPPVAEQPIATSVRRAFADGLSAVLARDAEAVSYVKGSFASAHPTLRAILIDGVAGTGSSRALSVLTGLLGAGPELDLLCLSAISGLARVLDEREDARAHDAVRHYLGSTDQRLVQGAVRAGGELRDAHAVVTWIRLLGGEDGNLAAAAELALRATSGRELGSTVETWERWYRDELAWWHASEARLLEALGSSSPAHIAEALNEVGEHRLFCRELEQLVVVHLSARDPLIAAMACSALGRLGSRAAIARLRELAHPEHAHPEHAHPEHAHADPRVIDAASQALRRILGDALHLPAGGRT